MVLNRPQPLMATPSSAAQHFPCPAQQFIQDVSADLQDLEEFYSISFSPTSLTRKLDYIKDHRAELDKIDFDKLDQEGQIDWLLIHGFLKRQQRQLQAASEKVKELHHLLDSWAPPLIQICEDRQRVLPVDGLTVAGHLSRAQVEIRSLCESIKAGKTTAKTTKEKLAAERAAQAVKELQNHLQEWFEFYNGYDPLLSWWIAEPWKKLPTCLSEYADLIREKLVGIHDEDEIIGQPVGRQALLDELEAEVIAYSPEELIEIAEREYTWCEKEMIRASEKLGFKDWHDGLEHVKTTYVPPGEQPLMIRALANEAMDYVKKHDMITTPTIANECWRTTMMSPARQKVNPFFLGGERIIVSYPKTEQSHEDKLMSMRGNNPAFSRSTVFHELVPGHHLQFYYLDRWRPYRKLFMTPFWTEGWAFYWEFILWDRGYPGQVSQKYATNEAENRIGMLFWRMHRCARIVFSLKFHLGQMTPRECVDYLVEKVGHERATAEGEVRRSFNGDYSPLYQAGYMLGALQLYALRKELVGTSGAGWSEKAFHDRVMREGMMPIELLRALLRGERLKRQRSPSWKFYEP